MNKSLDRIRTGKFERRLSMMRAGLTAGARLAGRSAQNWMTNRDDRSQVQSQILREEAEQLVKKMSELKGSVVKIGQMMALWGEHYLPIEVTDALHTLEDQTTPVGWPVMEAQLATALPQARIDELDIDPIPIGSASLGQVHLAVLKSTGEKICLKIQYPGIQSAIESDLDTVRTMLKLFRLVPNTKEFDLWFDEIRVLLRREVDYRLEATTTRRFSARLKDDARFVVPKVIERYSSETVLCLSFEEGVPIASTQVKELPLERRNFIATACVDICWQEVFVWGEMQTDPNFGNYLVRINHNNEPDQVVLLDFGAVRSFEPDILRAGRQMVAGSIQHEPSLISQALRKIGFYKSETPETVIAEFCELCYLAIEPFADPKRFPPDDPALLDEQQRYRWAQSKLATRALTKARSAVFSRYFKIPPGEFMFFSRKLMGTFTLLSVLQAQLPGYQIVEPYLETMNVATVAEH